MAQYSLIGLGGRRRAVVEGESAIVTAQIHMGMGGHSLGMMSCKGNLGSWEVRRRESRA